MIDFSEFIKRSTDGPVMSEREFDLKLSRQLRRLGSDYNIRFKAAEIICDDAAADAIFHAAVELVGQVGLYNMDTNRVILLSPEEVDTTCRETPKQFVRGAGKDAVTVAARSHKSQQVPYVFRWPLANAGYMGKEVFFSQMMQAHLSEANELGDIARKLKIWLNGVENKAGTVGDMMWAMAVAQWCVTVAKVIGQPDMFVGQCAGITVPAILACFNEKDGYRRHHSSISIHIMPELKVNWERLQLAFIARQMGVPRAGGLTSILGGYARNAEETAVVVTAGLLAQLSYGAADWAHLAPVDAEGNRSGRSTLQAHSGACRAAERNIGVATAGIQFTKNGLGSAFSLYEKAALIIEQTCSGISWSWQFPCHPGPDGKINSDLDYELVTRVAKAVSGMEREEANKLVNKILKLYEGSLDRPEKGKPYSYYYDLRTLTPLPELVDLHQRVEEELAGLGVPLS